MIELHSKYDNMNTNGMFYALICINNYVFACQDCMLSTWRDAHTGWSHARSRGCLHGTRRAMGWQMIGPRVSGPK